MSELYAHCLYDSSNVGSGKDCSDNHDNSNGSDITVTKVRCEERLNFWLVMIRMTNHMLTFL